MLTSPQVASYIEIYDSPFVMANKLDEESCDLLKELFQIADKIKNYSHGDTERRRFYFFAPKGTFEEYKNLYPDDSEECLKQWFETEQDQWHLITLVKDNYFEDPFLSVFIDNFYVLSVNDPNTGDKPEIEAKEFIKSLIEITADTIKELEAGTYNERIRKELPLTMRYGKISRSDYWDAFPEEKSHYSFSNHEKEVLQKCREESTPLTMTARKYYEICYECYKAVGLYDGGPLFEDSEKEFQRYNGDTPKEVYYHYADGRDEGLSTLPMDDEDEFLKWLRKKPPYENNTGGHPFEIVFSYSGRKSVHLYVRDDCSLFLTGGEYPANVMAAKMYVALKDNNIPVTYNAEGIIKRIEEKDFVNILPHYVWGGNDGDEDSVNLSLEDCERLKDKILWEEIPEVGLNAAQE